MNKIVEVMRREHLYVLLLIFIILVNVIMFLPADIRLKGQMAKSKVETKKMDEDLFIKRDVLEKMFYEKKYLALLFSLTSLLVFFVLFLGMAIDVTLLSLKLTKKKIEIYTYKLQTAKWSLWDVAKVAILFLFFGYMILIIESLLIRMLPLLKDDNFRMILNSSLLDTLTVVFILYFTVGQYKEKLISLGISFKNFFKNVFYGIVGYIATVPILIVLLAITAAVANLIKYVPPKQPVVDLFLKEKDVAFLTYTSIFAAIVGPIIEELFFRAFMYNAMKKSIGIFWSMLITACVFAALHTHIIGFLPIMVLGILLAYLYEKTGTLVSSVTVHTIHNFTMLLFVFLMKQLKA